MLQSILKSERGTKVKAINLAVVIAVLCLSVGTTAGHTYSITNIEDYLYSIVEGGPKDLTPWGTYESNIVKDWFTNEKWVEEFYHANGTVTKEDFGTSDSGYEGLDEADFHFHFGHGYSNPVTGGTWLDLWDYHPIYNPGAIVTPDDVYKKWDLNNEWVFIHACNILSEPER
jgi:hypothetical protein